MCLPHRQVISQTLISLFGLALSSWWPSQRTMFSDRFFHFLAFASCRAAKAPVAASYFPLPRRTAAFYLASPVFNNNETWGFHKHVPSFLLSHAAHQVPCTGSPSSA